VSGPRSRPVNELAAAEFDLDPRYVYLNHAGVAPWPRRTATAVSEFARENTDTGPLFYDRWLQLEKNLRRQLADLINAPAPEDIALVKNTSEALSFVAYGLEWCSGDNIVTTNQEFPSNRIVWESLRSRGVELREAVVDDFATSPEQALIDRVDERTRLITVSSVQYGSGLRLDLPQLGRFYQANEILFCIDAIQSLGAVPLDVQNAHADFVAADGHKWLLGPEGIGLFYVRSELRDQLQLFEYGWHMIANRGDYDRREWRPASDATRFECGSPNMLGVHALSASLSLLTDCGIDEIKRNITMLINMLYDTFNNNSEVEIMTPEDEARRAGIWTFRPRRRNESEIVAGLRASGIITASRFKGVRLSPHFYNTAEQLQKTIAVLQKLL